MTHRSTPPEFRRLWGSFLLFRRGAPRPGHPRVWCSKPQRARETLGVWPQLHLQGAGLGRGLTSRYIRGAGWWWGGLTSTYSSGNIPILSLSLPSAQLSSTLLITVKTSSWKWPMETSPGTFTKTDTETEPRDQSVSLMLRKDSK